MMDDEEKCYYVRLVLAGYVWADTKDAAIEKAKDIGTNLQCVDLDIKEPHVSDCRQIYRASGL